MFLVDTAGLASNNNLNDLVQFVNDGLKKFARWFRASKMAVNVSNQNTCGEASKKRLHSP
jgi:hypothetical protein